MKERKKKHQYGREQYKYLPEDEKQKLVEYIKKYSKMEKLINTSQLLF